MSPPEEAIPPRNSQLKQDVRALRKAIAPRAQALQRRYRQALRTRGFDQAFAAISPVAALEQPVDQWLQSAADFGRKLALDDVPSADLVTALHLFSSLDPALAEATLPFQQAAQAAATGGYVGVHNSEARTLAALLEIESASTGRRTLLEGIVDLVGRHFGAAETRLHQVGSSDAEPIAGIPFTKSAQLLKRLSVRRVFSSPKTPGVIDETWSESTKSVWSLPLTTPGDSICVAQLGFAVPRVPAARDRALLSTISKWSAFAVARIGRESRTRERSLNLIGVEELERSRVSRELHDEPAQSLAVVRLHIEMIEGSLPEQARAQLAEVRAVVEKTIVDVRRLISDLSPPVLEQLGVAAAIRQLVGRFRRSYRARVSLQLGKLPDLGQQYGLVLYRSLQECFSNISKHSSAKNINVSLTATDRVLRLHVEDDGVGFHVRETMSHAKSFGLIGIRERVSLLGGRLSVRSAPIGGGKKARKRGKGTSIEIELPLPDKNPS